MRKLQKKIGVYLFLGLGLVLMLSGEAAAQESGITLREALDLALANPNNLGTAQRVVDEAAAKRAQAAAGRWPSISFNTQYTKIGPYTTEHPMMPGVLVDVEATGSYNTGFSMQLPLYMGGKLNSAVQLADYGVESAELSYALETEDLIQQVIQAYIGFLKADRMWALGQEQITILKEHLRLVETNLRLGYAAKTDLLATQIQLTQAELAVVKAEHGRKLAAEHLANLLGVEPGALVLTSEPRIKAGFTLPDLELALQEAELARPELKSLAVAIRMAEENLKLSKGYWQPNLVLIGTYGTQNQSSPTLEDAVWTYTLNLDWRLWSGGAGRAEAAAAAASLQKYQHTWAQSKELIALEVRQNYLAAAEAGRVRELTALIRRQAEENYELVKAKYELGAATNLELLTAQTTLNSALNDQVTAEYDYYLAVAAFYRMLGQTAQFLREVSEDA
ncbi:MAG: TolC family protein [Firmicutes bacterium]|nr:TolC family protein [Bacillota bacterium]